MDKEIQFISWKKDEFGNASIKKKGYSLKEAYRGNQNLFMSCIREIHFKSSLPFKEVWYNKSLRGYRGIFIVKDAMMNYQYMKWLKENNPDATIIFWYWNRITSKKIQPRQLKELGCDVWSFNVLDCEKYDMKLNHTYYCDDYYEIEDNKGIKEKSFYDLAFIGKDKGRMEYVYQMSNQYPSLKFFIHITPSHFYLKWKDKRYKDNLPYKEVLEREKASKAILEIVPENSQGLTIRTMDAIYLGKKLVTNNEYIKKMDFYHPNDIFVLEVDDNLEEFIDKPYIPLEKQILSKYSFEEWINRFIE